MSLLDLAKSIGKVPVNTPLPHDLLQDLPEDFHYQLRFRLLKEFLALIALSYCQIPQQGLGGVIEWIKSHRPEIWKQISQTEDAIDLACISQVISLKEYKTLLDNWLGLYRKGFREFVREPGEVRDL